MGALPQTKLSNVLERKGPSPEVRKLDRYGRDPESIVEKLRGPGFSPLYHAMLADLPRLVEGSAAGWSVVMTILRLSLGRPHDSDKGRHVKTEPISTAELAELCRVNVKTIQRQLDELSTRGVISLKSIKQTGGFVKYVLSLELQKWQAIEDYAVWQRRQVVAIDEAAGEVEESDETPTEISKDAVHLTRKPQAVRPGRASRPVKVSVGVRELSFQNDSPAVDAQFNAVVTSGRLVVSATFNKAEGEAKSEDKANAERHACRAVPSDGGNTLKGKAAVTHPRAAEICKLFNPLLQKSGTRLLSFDSVSLQAACSELGNVPPQTLEVFMLGKNGRGLRSISGPRAVAAIIRECRENWAAGELAYQAALDADKRRGESLPVEDEAERPAMSDIDKAREILANPRSYDAGFVRWAKEQLAGAK